MHVTFFIRDHSEKDTFLVFGVISVLSAQCFCNVSHHIDDIKWAFSALEYNEGMNGSVINVILFFSINSMKMEQCKKKKGVSRIMVYFSICTYEIINLTSLIFFFRFLFYICYVVPCFNSVRSIELV